MERPFQTIDFRGQLILLGTGTSVGVPTIGCGCSVCTSGDPKNNRTRSGAIFGLPAGNLLIDTSPDMRQQFLREGIGIAHAIVFTHEHADHLHGLDDVRLFPFILGHPVPLYCTTKVSARIRRVFDYAFEEREQTHVGASPQLQLHDIDDQPFDVLGARLIPIPLQHGPYCTVLGFRIGNVAYCTDTNHIASSSLDLMKDLDCLILDALRLTPHATHFSVEQALEVIDFLRPKRALLTHLSHDLDYHKVNACLPSGVELAYDGQKIPLS